MKKSLLKPLLPFALMLSAILGLTGCLEESTVVKVNKDGSGLIHVRKYENTLAGKGLFGGLGGGEEKEEEKIDAPNEEELKAKARAMGEGVTLKSFRRGKNKLTPYLPLARCSRPPHPKSKFLAVSPASHRQSSRTGPAK